MEVDFSVPVVRPRKLLIDMRCRVLHTPWPGCVEYARGMHDRASLANGRPIISFTYVLLLKNTRHRHAGSAADPPADSVHVFRLAGDRESYSSGRRFSMSSYWGWSDSSSLQGALLWIIIFILLNLRYQFVLCDDLIVTNWHISLTKNKCFAIKRIRSFEKFSIPNLQTNEKKWSY